MNTFLKKIKQEKIVICIHSLNVGGAERQTVELAKRLTKQGMNVTIYCLEGGNFFEKELLSNRIKTRVLMKVENIYVPTFFLLFKIKKIFFLYHRLHFKLTRRFIAFLSYDNPDVIYCFGLLAYQLSMIAKFKLKKKIIWAISASIIDYSIYGWQKKYYLWLGAICARFTSVIISNSYAGKNAYVQKKFPENKIVVIPNGFDIQKFKPSCNHGSLLRKKLGINKTDAVIGHAARLNIVKDHFTFIKAISLFVDRYPQTIFLISGAGEYEYENKLKLYSERIGVKNNIIWLGEWDDMSEFYNAIDFLTLTSISEGLPNVIGEAMLCGKPCVTTDVGDCALLVKGTGIIVPHGDATALNVAWGKMFILLSQDPQLARRCREIIVNNYSIGMLASRFTQVIRQLN